MRNQQFQRIRKINMPKRRKESTVNPDLWEKARVTDERARKLAAKAISSGYKSPESTTVAEPFSRPKHEPIVYNDNSPEFSAPAAPTFSPSPEAVNLVMQFSGEDARLTIPSEIEEREL